MRAHRHNKIASACGLVLTATLLAHACTPLETGPSCLVSQSERRMRGEPWFSADVLFVIDDSPSMADEQALLQRELPRMFDMLLTGSSENPAYRNMAFAPIRNLHLGVIAADLGSGSARMVAGCSNRGRDGVLQTDATCTSSDLRYVDYYARFHDIAATRNAVRCNLNLGAAGCAIAQPLEALLKAVSDRAASENAGFLRQPGPDGQVAPLLIVIVTDQDDCSAPDDADAPSTRCSDAPERLYPLQRYVEALRPEAPRIRFDVEVALVVGVPADLVSDSARAPLKTFDVAQQDAFYSRILADPRMQLREGSDGRLEPSCESPFATATPPRRLVEFARRLRQDIVSVRSLCDNDLTLALSDLVWDWERHGIAAGCLTKPLPRDAQGRVPCHATWQLPARHNPAYPLTPSACDERPFLSVPESPLPRSTPEGNVICEVHQVPYQEGVGPSGTVEGFYYETDQKLLAECRAGATGRILFTPGAFMPEGVLMGLHCFDDVQRVAASPGEPAIGTACDRVAPDAGPAPNAHDALCARPGELLFCHPEKRICVRACSADTDCPKGWRCDHGTSELAANAGRAICINPNCR